MRRSSLGRLCFLLGAPALALGGGCAADRPELGEQALVERRQELIADQADLLEGVTEKLVARLESRGAPAGTHASSGSHGASEPVLNVLVISGGGAWGAFGAGFLSGWGEVADPEFRRPEFDLVWGVSTGAIMAPFAFACTDESCHRVEWFYRHPEPDWVELRDWFSLFPWRPSFMVNHGLQKSLEEAVSPDIIRQAAARSREGCALLVGATELDSASMVVWDVGAECERAAESGDSGRVVRILSASSAIPVAFPAVLLDNGLYADGGITSILLSRADHDLPGSVVARWRERNPSGAAPLIRYWVLMNIRVQAPSTFVEPKWPAVMEAALGASIRSATWLQTRLLAAQLDFLNAKGWARCELRAASIPEDWKPTVEGEFEAQTMNELADIGRKMGADPGSWMLVTRPLGE